MEGQSRFIYIIDRYLEVSNVYHQRMLSGADTLDAEDRADHLLALIEAVDPRSSPDPLSTAPDDATQGQFVAATSDFLEDTKASQQYVLKRLRGERSALSPHNRTKLETVLQLPAKEFLASFPTVGYAWDILTELASLSVLPLSEALAARDMIHMHAVELQLHLVRVIAQERLACDSEVALQGSLSVEELECLQRDERLVEKLVEFAVPKDPPALLASLDALVAGPAMLKETLGALRPQALSRLQQERRSFPDTLAENLTLDEARAVCDSLVVFGLVAGYAAWYAVALDDSAERRALRKNILFCTRILLDVKRWGTCIQVAQVALEILKSLHERCHDDPQLKGSSMITANLLFARAMSGQDIEEDVREWDTSAVHARYEFLKQVLLGDFDKAASLLTGLMKVDPQTNRPNMSIQEVKEWPILESFRNSPQGRKTVDSKA